MKKIIAMLLCLLMVLSLVACGAKEEPAADSKAPEAPAAEGPAEDTKAEEPAEESSDAAEGEPYKVGFFAPLSGGNAEYGQQNLNSVQLYAKLLNEKGGWFGRPVEIIPYDDQGDPTTSLAVVTKLIKEDKVDAICGTQQSACLIGRLPAFPYSPAVPPILLLLPPTSIVPPFPPTTLPSPSSDG